MYTVAMYLFQAVFSPETASLAETALVIPETALAIPKTALVIPETGARRARNAHFPEQPEPVSPEKGDFLEREATKKVHGDRVQLTKPCSRETGRFLGCGAVVFGCGSVFSAAGAFSRLRERFLGCGSVFFGCGSVFSVAGAFSRLRERFLGCGSVFSVAGTIFSTAGPFPRPGPSPWVLSVTRTISLGVVADSHQTPVMTVPGRPATISLGVIGDSHQRPVLTVPGRPATISLGVIGDSHQRPVMSWTRELREKGYRDHRTRDQGPGTSDQRPATSDQRPAISDQRSAISDATLVPAFAVTRVARASSSSERSPGCLVAHSSLESVKEECATMHNQERQFSFEKLVVWEAALEALAAADEVAKAVPRPYGELADQLRRASLSVVCNLAEGIGKEGKDQARFLRIARGSAYESGALIEAAARLGLVDEAQRGRARQPLLSVAALLTRLLRPVQEARP